MMRISYKFKMLKYKIFKFIQLYFPRNRKKLLDKIHYYKYMMDHLLADHKHYRDFHITDEIKIKLLEKKINRQRKEIRLLLRNKENERKIKEN